MVGISFWNTSGKTMPPIGPPTNARPVAFARLTLNQWPTDAMAGVNMREVDMPPKTFVGATS